MLQNQVLTTYPLKALNIEKKYKTLKSAQRKNINF